MKHSILFLAFLLTVSVVNAQTKNTPLFLKKSSGIEGGTVNAIDKRNTELLIGTKSGVYWSTDFGINWNIIQETIIDVPCSQVRIISEGNYVFAQDKSLYTYNRPTKTFTKVSELDSLFELEAAITTICSSEGHLHIGTWGGYIADYDIAEKKWTVVLDSSSSQMRIINGIVKTNTMYYAAVGKRVLKSVDGKTWSNTAFGGNTPNESFINSITIYENTPVLSCAEGVFRSTDNGETWFKMTDGLSTSDLVIKVQSDGKDLAAILVFGEIVRFDKKENKWLATDFPVQFGSAKSVYYDIDGMYVGGEYQGIFHSANGRNSFAPMNRGLEEVSVHAFTTFGTLLYAATSNGIYASTNNGIQWYPSGKQGTYFQDCIVHKGVLLMAGSDGIYRYEAQSGGWVFSGLPNTWCNSFMELNGKLLVSTGNHYDFHHAKIYESSDGGAGWADITNGDLNDESTAAIVRLDTNSTTLFAATDFGLFKRPIEGGNWSKVNIGNFLAQIVDFAVYDNLIVASIIQNVLVASTDNGASWIAYSNGIPLGGAIGNINGVKEINGTFYTLTDIGIYARKEDEDIWTKINDNFGTISFNNFGNYILVGSKHGVLYQDKTNTGIDDNSDNLTLTVYPNPAKDYINLQYNNSEQLADIHITDLLGRTVLLSQGIPVEQGNTISYDVSTLSVGQYLIQIGNRSVLFSVVK